MLDAKVSKIDETCAKQFKNLYKRIDEISKALDKQKNEHG